MQSLWAASVAKFAYSVSFALSFSSANTRCSAPFSPDHYQQNFVWRSFCRSFNVFLLSDRRLELLYYCRTVFRETVSDESHFLFFIIIFVTCRAWRSFDWQQGRPVISACINRFNRPLLNPLKIFQWHTAIVHVHVSHCVFILIRPLSFRRPTDNQ